MTMMKDGGTAFPVTPKYQYNEEYGFHTCITESGMSLRDWFAGRVLAMVADSATADMEVAEIAAYCYRLADAMLTERNKEDK